MPAPASDETAGFEVTLSIAPRGGSAARGKNQQQKTEREPQQAAGGE